MVYYWALEHYEIGESPRAQSPSLSGVSLERVTLEKFIETVQNGRRREMGASGVSRDVLQAISQISEFTAALTNC